MMVREIFICGHLLCNCDTQICSSEEDMVIWKFCSQNVVDVGASFCKVNAISEGMDLFFNTNLCLVCIFLFVRDVLLRKAA